MVEHPARGTVRLVTRAPAKVNLVLRVGARRPDGFHEIATLLAPLELADDVAVAVRLGRPGAVTCRVPGRPDLDGPTNLAARAALALRRRLGIGDAIAIRIAKRIPVTAGLGGGSSDAAAVLRCLARAWRVRDRAALAAAAAEVGSDVPFFLGSGPAWARGRGERLEPAALGRLHLVLLHPRHPARAIRAADAYAWLDAARRGAAPPLPRAGHPFRTEAVANDLQEPCFERHPALRGLRALLEEHGASAAIMSGSGPTVFGVFADRQAARVAAQAARAGGEAVDVIITRSQRRMPGVSPWKSPRSASSR